MKKKTGNPTAAFSGLDLQPHTLTSLKTMAVNSDDFDINDFE